MQESRKKERSYGAGEGASSGVWGSSAWRADPRSVCRCVGRGTESLENNAPCH